MKLLITGASGQLGRALLNQAGQTDNIETFPFSSKDLDITNEALVKEILFRLSPDVVINCAAHTAVDACETDAKNAYRINALGPEYLAKACEACGASMVQVSTDYVFDGTKRTPYIEEDIPNPQSIYGSAWLYGSGHNFVRTMLGLAQDQKAIRVVNDQYGTPTSHLELARMLLYLIKTKNYGIYHATCEGSTTWYDFAREIFSLTNTPADLTPVTSSEFKTAAKRPSYSVLENRRLNTKTPYQMAKWQDALAEYLNNYK